MTDIRIGINLEFVRHADKSFEYGGLCAAEMGYRYIEPCFLMGTCLLSNAGYCHIRSLDMDPQYFKDFCQQRQLKISGVSSHSDLLDTRIGVEYARKGIMYARAWRTVDCSTLHPWYKSARRCTRRNGWESRMLLP